ncbi:MAG: hypothetical protein QM692_05425 [Thermomicrobiales bacterium]
MSKRRARSAGTPALPLTTPPPPLPPPRVVTAAALTGWVRSGSPFTLTRWGDGEWHAVLGRTTGRNSDGQAFVPELGERLRQVLRRQPPYLMELKPWEAVFGDQVAAWLAEERLSTLNWIAPDILHRASRKGQLAPVIAALRAAPALLMIGPAHLRATQALLGFRHLIEVPPTNAFAALAALEAAALAAAAALPRGAVVSVSAGMTANILIDTLHRQCGRDLILLDAGSLWDPYAGVRSRGYMRSAAFHLAPGPPPPEAD